MMFLSSTPVAVEPNIVRNLVSNALFDFQVEYAVSKKKTRQKLEGLFKCLQSLKILLTTKTWLTEEANKEN